MERKEYILHNKSYQVDGIRHIFCLDCIPDSGWINDMVKSGRLTNQENDVDEDCEYCGC